MLYMYSKKNSKKLEALNLITKVICKGQDFLVQSLEGKRKWLLIR